MPDPTKLVQDGKDAATAQLRGRHANVVGIEGKPREAAFADQVRGDRKLSTASCSESKAWIKVFSFVVTSSSRIRSAM
jgi:hypothetical protein